MEQQILKELKELKGILSRVIGTDELPLKQRFSTEAIDKAAREFREMAAARGEWVNEDDLKKYIPGVPYRPGRFLREHFGFVNCYKKSYDLMFFKKDVIAFAKEIKKKKINLERYEQFIREKAAFDKKIDEVKKTAEANPKKKFKVPPGVRDITTSAVPPPDPALVREDIERLKALFLEQKLGGYIDIYKSTYAMLKSMYHFQKYIDPALRRRCTKWCDDFNYANHALELITRKKEKFNPPDPTAIEL